MMLRSRSWRIWVPTLFLVVPAALFLLEGCGVPVCVAGLGQCSQATKNGGTTTGTPSGTNALTLSPGPTLATVRIGTQVSFSVTGGTAPYTFSVYPTNRDTYGNPIAGSVSTTDDGTDDGTGRANYSPPNTIPTMYIYVMATDSSNKQGYVRIQISN